MVEDMKEGSKTMKLEGSKTREKHRGKVSQ
jgi:hypothetical protein